MAWHTTNRAEKRKDRMMQKATWKTAVENSRIEQFPRSAAHAFHGASLRTNNEKNLENLPRVFLRKNPGARSPKPNQPKNRKDA
jgi:hypothetical protein